MFFGTTPAPVRDYLASELQRTKSKRVFEPCAGNFVLSFVCGALDKTIEVRSGDVSLYSVAIGCGLASKDIGIKLKDEYLETYPFFKGKSSPIEVAATVIMWAELAKNLERKHIAYYASLARDLTENAEKYFVEILGKIKKAKESLGNFSFTAQDACITIQDAGEGDFVLYDPPYYIGDYEKEYAAMCSCFDAPAIPYTIITPELKAQHLVELAACGTRTFFRCEEVVEVPGYNVVFDYLYRKARIARDTERRVLGLHQPKVHVGAHGIRDPSVHGQPGFDEVPRIV